MRVKRKAIVGLLFCLLVPSGASAQVKTLVWSSSDAIHCDVWTEPETGQRLLRISNDGVAVAQMFYRADKRGVMVVFYITNNSPHEILYRFSDFSGVVSSPGFEALNLSRLSSYKNALKPEAMRDQQGYMTNPSQPIALGPDGSEFIWVLFDKPKTKPHAFRELRFAMTIDDTEYIFPDHFLTETPAIPTSEPQATPTPAIPSTQTSSTQSGSVVYPVARSAEVKTVTPNVAGFQYTINFVIIQDGHVTPLMPQWAIKWVKKNEKHYPGVRFSTSDPPIPGAKNFVVAFSASSAGVQGFEPVTHTDTSTSTSPVSGSGTVTDNEGEMWNYTYDGTVTTTTTTTMEEQVPYTETSNTLYITAFNEQGQMAYQGWRVFSSRQGGNPYNSLGYNLGSALSAINARGHLLKTVVDNIVPRK